VQQHGILSDQQCEAGQFWICTNAGNANPPFFGCCKSNPCTTGACPVGDLAPAYLNAQPASYAVFVSVASASSSTTATTTATTGTADSTPIITSAGNSGTVTKETKAPIVPIVIGVVVGVVVLLIAVILGFCLIKRRKRKQNAEHVLAGQGQHPQTAYMRDHTSDTGYYAASHSAKSPASPYVSDSQSSHYADSPYKSGVSQFEGSQYHNSSNSALPYMSSVSDLDYQRHSGQLSPGPSMVSSPVPVQLFEMDGRPRIHQDISELPAPDSQN